MSAAKNKRQTTHAGCETPQRPEDSWDIDYRAVCHEQGEVITHLNRLIDSYQKSLRKSDMMQHSLEYDPSRTAILDAVTGDSEEDSRVALHLLLSHLQIKTPEAEKTVQAICKRLYTQYRTIRQLLRLEDAAMRYLDPFLAQQFADMNDEDEDDDD